MKKDLWYSVDLYSKYKLDERKKFRPELSVVPFPVFPPSLSLSFCLCLSLSLSLSLSETFLLVMVSPTKNSNFSTRTLNQTFVFYLLYSPNFRELKSRNNPRFDPDKPEAYNTECVIRDQ